MHVCFPVAFSEQSWIATPVIEKNPPKKHCIPREKCQNITLPFSGEQGLQYCNFL